MEKKFQINEKGHNIRCHLFANDPSQLNKVIVFAHGFGGSKDNASVRKIAERALSKYKGVGLVSFNWPGHGDDVKKKILMDDCMDYYQSVLDYCINVLKAKELYSSSVSFGGFMTLKWLSERGNPFKKIVLRSPAITMYQALTNRIIKNQDFEKLQKGKDVSAGFDRITMIDQAFLLQLQKDDPRDESFIEFAEKMLIIHGADDELIQPEEVIQFADDNVIELVLVEGADHRFHDPKKFDVVLKKTFEFFDL